LQTDTALTETVREVMSETFGVDESDLPEDINQHDYSRWTSLAHLTLLVALEEKFGLSFATSEMTAMTSLPAIIATLKKHGV
jgi:acyl carrier protein